MNLQNSTPWTRREFLRAAAQWTAGAGVATATYGGFFERTHVVVQRVEVALERLPHEFDGFTIAQLSDFHYHPLFSAGVIRKAVELAAAQNPDLIVLTGDYVTVSEFRKRDPKSALEAVPCAELLAPLTAPFGVCGVLGNHDSFTDPEVVAEALTARGIKVLRNEAVPLERNGARIWLAGLADVLVGAVDLRKALALVPSTEATVLLVHEPDFADQVSHHPVDLQLSGHSHGGQIRFPVVGAPMLPSLGRKYPRGLRTVRKTALYTNIGLGTIIVPVRLMAAPEVTILTLRATKVPS
jgi:predicted MPP superfamily phosphohydrolase